MPHIADAPTHSPNPLGRYRDTIFFVSGFAGLIYESAWTHYLKLFLGHAAYAQTLVLAIFMGGMAVGAALTARYTSRIARPLRAYAVVEAVVGLFALAFHSTFTLATREFYDAAFTWHLGGLAFESVKWGLATLLILPQSILLGATFPLFASAATRVAPAAEGRPIATLYFANSLGGALGVLAAGFLLAPSFGLFGTIVTAGALNVSIAMAVFMLSNRRVARSSEPIAAAVAADARAIAPSPRGRAAASARDARKQASSKRDRTRGAREASAPASSATPVAPTTDARSGPRRKVAALIVLGVAFFTGASSFVYEIGWIRMLALVLGSATHSFELMLSSFLLGLAFGGLWIRKRIDTAANPGVFLGYTQIAMGCAALATVPLHNLSFDIIGWILATLPKTDAGYTLFNIIRYGVASLIMFPAAFFAGMTLPLATRLLYSEAGQGERAIGRVYSANTIGAIAGLAFAVHIGLPVIGLEYLVGTGAMIDVVLGAVLLVSFGARTRRKYAYAVALSGVVATYAVAQTFDPKKLVSGVFRTGKTHAGGQVLEVAHGKTATISVESNQGVLAIATNGKRDASADVSGSGRFVPDQLTVAFLGIVPLLLHDAPLRVANIGFGSGLTGEAILSDPRVERLDTIEIEPRMVELARRFDPLNRNVYRDPRSVIRIEDAKSFFAANGRTYDLIVSEPSNPWVSGVSSLFSVEFYRHVSRYLNEDGLFAQWLHTYETHPDRVASVLKAMDEVFDDYLVMTINAGDVLFIGKPRGKIVVPAAAYARAVPTMKERLRTMQIVNQSDLTLRIAGGKGLFRPWLHRRGIPANSDFVPYLDSNADRDRFFNKDWPELIEVALSAVPIAETLGGRAPLPTPSALTITTQFGHRPLWLGARMVWESLFGPMRGEDVLAIPRGLPPELASMGPQILESCAVPPAGDVTLPAARIATRVLPYLSPGEGNDVLKALRDAACLRGLTGNDAQWRELLQQIANRDAARFGAVADQMLMTGQGTNVVKTRYLLAMAMLGRIRSGERDRARALWTQFSPRVLKDDSPGIVMELLHAHAFAAASGSP